MIYNVPVTPNPINETTSELQNPMTKRLLIALLSLLLVVILLLPSAPASAQALTARDVIAAVNTLRAGGNLSPYQVDSWLMDYAQEHSEYQASINTSTHLHSDGLVPSQHGVIENVAAGDLGFLTVEAIISPIWADPVHMKTMVGYTSGFLGVGVASNATTTFVTLDVRPGSSAATVTPPVTETAGTPGVSSEASTQLPFVPIVTNTPLPDGSIVHVVTEGETLWEIAISYGVKVNDILQYNGLSAGNTAIYVGQKLIIRLPVTATATTPAKPSATATRPPTRTPRPPTPTHVPTWTPIPTISPTPTRAPLIQLPSMPSNKSIAYVLIGIGALGLLVLLITSFRK